MLFRYLSVSGPLANIRFLNTDFEDLPDRVGIFQIERFFKLYDSWLSEIREI